MQIRHEVQQSTLHLYPRETPVRTPPQEHRVFWGELVEEFDKSLMSFERATNTYVYDDLSQNEGPISALEPEDGEESGPEADPLGFCGGLGACTPPPIPSRTSKVSKDDAALVWARGHLQQCREEAEVLARANGPKFQFGLSPAQSSGSCEGMNKDIQALGKTLMSVPFPRQAEAP